MKYNILENYSSDVIENHIFIAQYNDSKTEILNVKEIYNADLATLSNHLTMI